MGRSGLAGRFFAELLRMRQIKSSVIGDTLAKPVNPGDVVFAFSGSGWTKTTTLYAEMSIQRGAILVAFTASKKSKLDRLADISLYLPGRPILNNMDYVARKMAGRYKSPLAPMGSVSEFSALLFGTGLALSLDSDNPIRAFRDAISTVIAICKKSIGKVLSNKSALERFIEKYVEAKRLKRMCYFSGLGLLEHISQMVAMRFQHLGLLVSSISDWILRKPGDVLTVMSGSGEASIPKILAEEALNSNMSVLAVVGNENSTLAKLAEIYLALEDIEDRKRYFALGREDLRTFIPAFEIATFILFEAIIAELAYRFGLTEEVMRTYHANIE